MRTICWRNGAVSAVIHILLAVGILICGSYRVQAQQRIDVDSLFTRAQIALTMEGNLDTASKLFQKVLSIQPDNAVAHAQLARISMQHKNVSRAMRETKRALEADPENPEYREQYAALLFYKEKYQKAAKVFMSLAKGATLPASYLLKAEVCYAYDGAYETALSVLNQAIKATEKVNESTGVMVFEKARLLLALERYQEAVSAIQYYIDEYHPDEVTTRRLIGIMANVFETFKNKEGVDRVMRYAVRSFPKDLDVITGAITYFALRGNDGTGGLVNYFLHSGNFSTFEQLNFFRQLVNTKKRQPRLEHLLNRYLPEVAENSIAGQRLYTAFLIQRKKLDRAVHQVEKMLAKDSTNTRIWKMLLALNWQRCKVRDTSSREAKAYLDTLKNTFKYAKLAMPGSALPYYFMGGGFIFQRQGDAAISVLKKGISLLTPADSNIAVSIRTLVAGVLMIEQKYAAAIPYYRKALSYDSTNISLLNDYSFSLALAKQDLELARHMSARSLEADPDNAAYLDTYGWILYQMKKYESALEFLERARENAPASPDICEHLGDVEFALGHRGKARKYWQRARRLGSTSETLAEKLSR